MTTIGVLLMDKSGRRPLLLVKKFELLFLLYYFAVFYKLSLKFFDTHAGVCSGNMRRMLPGSLVIHFAGSFNNRI